MMLPTRFLPVGAEFTRQGVTLKVVARPVATLHHREACKGCYFDSVGPCVTRLACSRFDRRDRKSVWFIPDETEKH